MAQTSYGTITVVDVSDGAQWYSGTAITDTSVTPTVFANSGITYAVEGDMYLNTSTNNTYRCTLGGNASTAKWVYINNIKGQSGQNGVSISSIVSEYCLSNSSASANGNWSTQVPSYISGYYYWTRQLVTWSNNTTSYSPSAAGVLDNSLTDANRNAATAVSTANTASQTATEAAKTATKYITKIDDSGIKIQSYNDTTNTADSNNYAQLNSTSLTFYRNGVDVMNLGNNAFRIGKSNSKNVYIDNNAVQIKNGSTQLASYGSTITLGQESGKNVKINSNGVTINNGSTSLASYGNIVKIGNLSKIHLDLNDTYLSLKQSDASSQLISFGLKNDSSTGLATLTKRGYMVEMTVAFGEEEEEDVLEFCSDLNGNFIPENAVQILSVYQIINEEIDIDNPISPSVFTIKYGSIYILDVSSNLKNKMIQITFTTNDKIPFLELGDGSQCYGANSIASGETVTVYGQKSFAIGDTITVFGDHSLAAGNQTTVTTSNSMAYGYGNSVQGEYSLAGGFDSKASGQASVALGQEAKATGPSSIALGYCVASKGAGSLACGQYNNGNSVYNFTVGNGYDQDTRQNAFWVGSSGNCGVQNNLYIGGVMRSGDTSGSSPMFWYETKTLSNISISANSAATGKELNIYKQNYSAVGVVGIRITNSSSGGSNAANCNVYIYTIVNSDHITFSIKNFASTAAKVDVEFKVFYIATLALSSQLS